jgi:hypothetical protein
MGEYGCVCVHVRGYRPVKLQDMSHIVKSEAVTAVVRVALNALVAKPVDGLLVPAATGTITRAVLVAQLLKHHGRLPRTEVDERDHLLNFVHCHPPSPVKLGGDLNTRQTRNRLHTLRHLPFKDSRRFLFTHQNRCVKFFELGPGDSVRHFLVLAANLHQIRPASHVDFPAPKIIPGVAVELLHICRVLELQAEVEIPVHGDATGLHDT